MATGTFHLSSFMAEFIVVLCLWYGTVQGQDPEFDGQCTQVTVPPDDNDSHAIVYWPIQLAHDANGNPAAVSCDPPPGSTFKGGINFVECLAVDTTNHDNKALCNLVVNVFPNIETGCPADIVQESSTVSFNLPTAFDSKGKEIDFPCTPGSGDNFSPGLTIVNCTGIDPVESTEATCSFKVTIGTLPTFDDLGSCDDPAVVNVAPDNGTNTASAITGHWARPTQSGGGIARCKPDPDNSTFPAGETDVNCTISNETLPSLINTCSFKVRVFPIFKDGCPANIVQENGTAVHITPPIATASNGSLVTGVCDKSSKDIFEDGETLVTCSAMDDVLTTQEVTCSFIVAIGSLPEFEDRGSCDDGRVDVAPDGGGMSATGIAAGVWTRPTKKGGENADCIPDPDTATFVGEATQVICTIRDSVFPSITDTCSFNVGVFPSFDEATLPGDEIRSPDPGANVATFAWLDPVAVDRDGADSEVTCTPSTGTQFKGGEHTISCKATAASSDESTYKFTLIVAPTFNTECPSDIIQATNPVSFSTPIGDNDAMGVPFEVTCSKNDGDIFDPGLTTVSCSVTDPVTKLSADCSFQVTIVDAPMFESDPPCDEDFHTQPAAWESKAYGVQWPVRKALQTDGEPADVSCEPTSGTDFDAGDTNVTCTAVDTRLPVDASPSSTCDFKVRVYPTFATGCPDNIILPSNTEEITAVVNYSIPLGAIDSSGMRAANVSCDPDSGSQFAIENATVVICTAVDSVTGGVATCNFTIMFLEAPTFDKTQPCDEDFNTQPHTGANVAKQVYWPERTATQENGEQAEISYEPARGTEFTGGDTPVTCTATDTLIPSLKTTCIFNVRVYPTFVTGCPADHIETPDPGNTTVVDFEIPDGDLDSTGVASNVTCEPDSGTAFINNVPTTVTCTAVDSDRVTFPNVTTCAFRVIVAEAPTFNQSCPTSSIIVGAMNTDGKAIATWDEVTGNRDTTGQPATVYCDHISGSTFNQTKTIVTCIVIDAGTQLTSNCSFMVIIDTEEPTIFCPDNMNATANAGGNTAIVSWDSPDVSDNYTPKDRIRVLCIPASSTLFQYGVTPVVCSAIDDVNNIGMCSFDVEVTGAICETCPPNSECTLLDNGESLCVCDNGYTGAECTNMNECEDSSPCHPDAICEDLDPPAFYSCECKEGFYGDGVYSCERYFPAEYPDIPLTDGSADLEKVFLVVLAIANASSGGCDPEKDKMSFECLILVNTFKELVLPLYFDVSLDGFKKIMVNQTDLRKGSVVIPHTVIYNYSVEAVRGIQPAEFYAKSIQSDVDAGKLGGLQLAPDCTECTQPIDITNVCTHADKSTIICPDKSEVKEYRDDSTGYCIFKCVSICESDSDYCNGGSCSQNDNEDPVCSDCPRGTELPRCTPVVQPTTPPVDEGPNIPLIVGLSVGLGGTLLLIIILNILYCMHQRRHDKANGDFGDNEGGADNADFRLEERYRDPSASTANQDEK